MSSFRRVDDRISVSPQIAAADIQAAADQGFRLVINNRPDGEEPGQPGSAEMEAAAARAGVAYAYVPVQGGPTREQVQTVHRLVADSDGPVLAYCRSGTRSIVTWALGQAAFGGVSRDELVQAGRAAGYDLTAALG